jgi:RNA polymerase sigma factor (sigma-70 family)
MFLSPDIASFEHSAPEAAPDQQRARIGMIQRHVGPKGAMSQKRPVPNFAVRPEPRAVQAASRSENWQRRSDRWGSLMVAARGGQSRCYDKLLRELDTWLRRYYGRRLPPAAAEDARQDALLAVHANRHSYLPSRPFGPWVAAIARYKWIDHVRDANRFAAISLHNEVAIEARTTAIDAIEVDDLLRRLKPAQARAISLVKLHGVSIEDASSATGQSTALVKINIHRGLKKLAALAAGDAITRAPAANSSHPRSITSNPNRANGPSTYRLRNAAATDER